MQSLPSFPLDAPAPAVDGSAELAERGKGFLEKSLGRAVTKGKLDEAVTKEDQEQLLQAMRV